MLGLAIQHHWFDEEGKTPLEAVWYSDFEDLLYQVNIILALENK
jgi:hypothetical protein